MAEQISLIDAVRDQLLQRGLVPTERDYGSDLTIRVDTVDGPQYILVEVKSTNMPYLYSPLHNDMDVPGSGPQRTHMLAERYISPRRGQALRERRIPYVDTVGNMWLELPGVHIAIEGRAAPPPENRGTSGDRLSRPSSLRIIFVLLIQPQRLQSPLRELATLAGISVGAAQAALADLGRAGYLHDKSPNRRLRRTGRLAEQWVHDFASRLLPKLEQRVVRGPAPQWWFHRQRDQQLESVSFGGESACELLGYPIRAAGTVLYGRPPWGSTRTLGRLGQQGEAVVVLREQFWPGRAVSDGVAPSLLIYADLVAAADPRLDEMAALMRERDDELRRIWAE